MTDLAAALDGLDERIRRGPACGVTRVLAELGKDEPDTRDKLVAAIDGHVPVTKIADVLIEHGHPINSQTLRRHRNRQTARGCACPR